MPAIPGNPTAIASRDRVNAHRKGSISSRKNLQDWLDVLQQIIFVTGPGEQHFFAPREHARQIINFFGVQARDIFLDLRGKGRLREKRRPRRLACAGDKLVFAECFLVEKCAAREAIGFLEISVINSSSLCINTEFDEQL